ncbi:MAG: type III pantothenate kinase [Deltaproteobacteria bacterium]|nr:MAG: type III pantothenate kinase [Deltaproteobacteria bacterium]
MLLVIDVGNTNTVLGLYDGTELVDHWRVATNPMTTTDELGVLYLSLFAARGIDKRDVEAAIVSNVVPPMAHPIRRGCRRYFDVSPVFVTSDTDTGIEVRYDNPAEVGADRVVNAVAAYHHHKRPCIVVDFGTATTFDVVLDPGVYTGGVIAPGLGVALEALIGRAARLPKVEIKKPASIMGFNTISAIQAGTVYGYIGLVDGIVSRILDEHPGVDFHVVSTGGLAALVTEESQYIESVEPFLTLEGLRLIHERLVARSAGDAA